MGRFASTVEFYALYQEPYSPEFFRAVAERLGLNGRGALLDVGCGPAQLAIGSARFVASCTGLDPEPAMIEAAKAAAEQARTYLTLRMGPGETQALWALMGMGAMLSGALGVPLTAILFSLELTHALPALLPLALACIASYLVTSLVMPRSILTEKLSRRGYHLSREYGVDPLEMISVADVMTEHPADAVQTEDALQDLPEVLAYSDETCRAVAEEMATTGVMKLPVVDRETGLVIGSISAQELLSGRRHAVTRESERNWPFQLQPRRR